MMSEVTTSKGVDLHFVGAHFNLAAMVIHAAYCDVREEQGWHGRGRERLGPTFSGATHRDRGRRLGHCAKDAQRCINQEWEDAGL